MAAAHGVAPRFSLFPVALVGIVVLSGGLLPAGAPRAGATPTTLTLSAGPTSGAAPLTVEFSATLTPATNATFNWSFGDGSSVRIASTGTSDLDHQYGTPGDYLVEVTATTNSTLLESNLVVAVGPGPVVAQIQVSAREGTVPLTVTFQAEITGGTGTYPTVQWSFGNGERGSGLSLNVTYLQTGSYVANLTVADTAGHAANASVTIRADPRSGSTTPATPVSPEWVLLGVAFASGGIAIVAYALAVWRGPSTAAGIVVPEGAARERTTPAAAPAAGGGSPRGRSLPSGEAREAYERILTHLYWVADRPASSGGVGSTTQEGMARELGVAPSTVGRALRRLSAAGMVRSFLEYVPGSPRRLTCYALTPRGRALARALQPASSEGSLPTTQVDPARRDPAPGLDGTDSGAGP